MNEPASWLVVEPGWTVVGADGGELGTVEEVAGDTVNDIFNGLAVAGGLFSAPKYVPAERVTRIYEGRVETTLRADELDSLEPYER